MSDFTVQDDQAGQRLDIVLAAQTGSSRSQATQVAKAGRVTVNGVIAKPRQPLKAGDVVAVTPAPASEVGSIPLPPIIYQDDDMLVIDKPAGVVTHVGGDKSEASIAGAIRELVEDDDPDRPGIVHRLDRDTSGLLLVARHPAAKAYLQDLFRRRQVTKTYLALVVGHPKPPAAVIHLPLGRSSAQRQQRTVDPEGRQAATSYRTIGTYPGYSLIEAQPQSGRTHQIRAHLKALGHPVAADRLYGAPPGPAGLQRQFLHAARLQLVGPSGQVIDVASPLPPDLAQVLAHLETGLKEPGSS